ncbi:MAG: hypothetical protein PHX13_04940 [Thiovulaceae bacterium]|nr:hypothetical protein [Sulfurimonadaceae bacterium]
MYTVIVEKQCGCFKKSGHEAETSFDNKDDALLFANERKNFMNSEWCGKHNFFVEETGDDLLIKMNMAG